MLKLARYLKPYLGAVVLTIALLFAQANADLALPDYMSRIVNVGIQQGGIDSPVPAAIPEERARKALAFSTREERDLALSVLSLAHPGEADHEAALRRYPGAAGTGLYLAEGKSRKSWDVRVEGIWARAMATLLFMEERGGLAVPAVPGAPGAPSPMGGMAIPPGVDMATMLDSLPEERKSAMLAPLNARLDSLDPSMLEQIAIRSVTKELESLGTDMDALRRSTIFSYGFAMLLLTLMSAAATIIVGYLSARVAAGFARDLRREVFSRVEHFSFAEMDRFSTASLITRSTNDINQLQQVSMIMMRMVFYAPIIGIGGVIRAMSKATGMWWIIALAVGVLIAVIATVFTIAVPRFKRIQKLVDALNLVVRENLSGMMVIRAFGMQEHEAKRFDRANRDLTDTMLFVTRVTAVMMPIMMLIMNLVSVLIIWTGAHEIAAGSLAVGDMMAFMQYSMQIFFAFLMMSFMFIILPRASVSGERIAEVLATEPVIVDPENPVHLPAKVKGELRFEHVSFRYPGAGEDVLHEISFVAKPGTTTAIIGTTGAGKSTLVSLVPRFYDPSAGRILLDGIDVRQLAQSELRASIGFVPQKSTLFQGTVATNMRYANPSAGEAQIEKALSMAQAADFTADKGGAEAVEIAQGGTNVSGGQRQRLAIARALMRSGSGKTPVFIFDDSFSALDYATDTKLRRALKSGLTHATVIIVTQRVATIRDADQILVLDEGRLVGAGRHRELMEQCEVYRDIALSQLKQEELA